MGEKHILLADADAGTLEEFRPALGPQWSVARVDTGAAVLAALREKSYDVLVASLHLPDIATSQLLNRVRAKHPKTVRFVVAAEQDRHRVFKEVLGAHQFLTRPFEASTLRDCIERAMAFELWVENDKLRELVARMRTLPTVPALYLELLAALKSPDTTTEEIGVLIARDMSITTKLLQVINSAYFGLPRIITSPEEAVGLLGFETVKAMVLAIKLLNQYDRIKPSDFSIDGLWQHSTAVAQNARRLVLLQTGNRGRAEEAFAAGLLHDAGKVVLAGNFADQYRGAQVLAAKQQIPLWQVEKEIFGASHGEVGAYLLGLWGLPLEILETAALHHQPCRASNRDFSALTAVHVANVLEHERCPDAAGPVEPKIDTGYVDEIGLLECLPAWREEVLGPAATDPDIDDQQPESKPSGSCIPGPGLASVSPPSLGIGSSSASRGGDSPEVEGLEAPVLAECRTDESAHPCQAFGENEAVCPEEPGSLSAAAIGSPRKNRRLYAEVAFAFVLLVGWVIVERLPSNEEEPIIVKAQQAQPEPTVGSATMADPQTKPGRESRDTTSASSEERSVVEVLSNQVAAPLAPGRTDLAPVAGGASTPLASTASSNSFSPASGAQPAVDAAEPETIPKLSSFPVLKLQGIIFSREHPSAIINGLMVRPNDRISGVRVVEIRSTSVTLEFEHQSKRLSLE